MTLLENELVRKYFGACEHGDSLTSPCLCRFGYASRVLEAMQEPMKKGDKYLAWDIHGAWMEKVSPNGTADFVTFHPYDLPLPSRFQPPENRVHVCGQCPNCGPLVCQKPPEPKVDEVEAKARRIAETFGNSDGNADLLYDALRDLVALVLNR